MADGAVGGSGWVEVGTIVWGKDDPHQEGDETIGHFCSPMVLNAGKTGISENITARLTGRVSSLF
jgi:hypothetical protein